MTSPSLTLYTKMYLIRRAEELIVQHYLEDEMKTPMHMSMGQEAVAVAVCQALGSRGQVFGFYRSHALFLAKTDDPEAFFGELHGRTTGTAHGKSGSMHLAAPERGLMATSAIVGASIPVAVGAAFANRQKGNDVIACAYFGDGALEEGVFWESLNVACVMRLPVLFVCEDNGLAVHSTREVRQGFRSISEVVRKFDCTVYDEDSTCVEHLYRAALAATESIKREGRPAFVHMKCRRYLDHIGIAPDYDIAYNSKAEFEESLQHDSLLLQRRRLLSIGYTEEEIADEEQKVSRRAEESLRKAVLAPLPPAEELYRGVFYEGH